MEGVNEKTVAANAQCGSNVQFHPETKIGNFSIIGDGVIGKKKVIMGDIGCIEPGLIFYKEILMGNRACVRRLDKDDKFTVANLPRGRRCLLIRGECVEYAQSICIIIIKLLWKFIYFFSFSFFFRVNTTKAEEQQVNESVCIQNSKILKIVYECLWC